MARDKVVILLDKIYYVLRLLHTLARGIRDESSRPAPPDGYMYRIRWAGPGTNVDVMTTSYHCRRILCFVAALASLPQSHQHVCIDFVSRIFVSSHVDLCDM